MIHYAYLTAVYMLGSENHSGQWSKGYRLQCMALSRAQTHHTGASLGRTVEQLRARQLYPRGCEFRNWVAYFVKKLRKYRNTF